MHCLAFLVGSPRFCTVRGVVALEAVYPFALRVLGFRGGGDSAVGSALPRFPLLAHSVPSRGAWVVTTNTYFCDPGGYSDWSCHPVGRQVPDRHEGGYWAVGSALHCSRPPVFPFPP